jgi:mannose-6-phosphate isomerase-like protein (cupin superfamily)
VIAVEAIVRKRGEGSTIPRPGTHGSVTIKAATGASTVFETQRPAGDAGGPAVHSHPGFDETFYVVSGEWEFVVGDDTITADAGMVVHLPRGVFHTFRSTGRVDGTLVGVAVPGGIEDFFEEAARTANDDEAGRHHGIEFV